MENQARGFTLPFKRNSGVTDFLTALRQRGVERYLYCLPCASQFTVVHQPLSTAGIRAYQLLGLVGSSNRTCATITIVTKKMSSLSLGETLADALSNAGTESNSRFPGSLQGVWPFELFRQGDHANPSKGLCAILKMYFLAQGVLDIDEVMGYDSTAFIDDLSGALGIVAADLEAKGLVFSPHQASIREDAPMPQKAEQDQHTANTNNKIPYRALEPHAEMAVSYHDHQPVTAESSFNEHTPHGVASPFTIATAAAPASHWAAYPNPAVNPAVGTNAQYPVQAPQPNNPTMQYQTPPPEQAVPSAQFLDSDPMFQELRTLLLQGEATRYKISELNNNIAREQQELQQLERSKAYIESQFNHKCQGFAPWQRARYVAALMEVGRKGLRAVEGQCAVGSQFEALS